jgi:hypothetical protein
VAGWEAAEPGFASRVQGYRRIRIEPARFEGYEAAVWEYTYSDRHASNLAILAGDYGFALNFQTSEGRWAGQQGVRAALEAGFRPPG